MLINELTKGCIVHLKSTATYDDGRIIPSEIKQKVFKVCHIDDNNDVVNLSDMDDSGSENINVRSKDIADE